MLDDFGFLAPDHTYHSGVYTVTRNGVDGKGATLEEAEADMWRKSAVKSSRKAVLAECPDARMITQTSIVATVNGVVKTLACVDGESNDAAWMLALTNLRK